MAKPKPEAVPAQIVHQNFAPGASIHLEGVNRTLTITARDCYKVVDILVFLSRFENVRELLGKDNEGEFEKKK